MTKCLLNTKSHDNTMRRIQDFRTTPNSQLMRGEKMTFWAVVMEVVVAERNEITSKIRFDECKCVCMHPVKMSLVTYSAKKFYPFTRSPSLSLPLSQSIFGYHQKWITSRSILALPLNFSSTLLFFVHECVCVCASFSSYCRSHSQS